MLPKNSPKSPLSYRRMVKVPLAISEFDMPAFVAMARMAAVTGTGIAPE